jgi:micrococcal nuclease
MKRVVIAVVGFFLLVIVIFLLGLIVLFGGLALALFGFLIFVAPIILDWSMLKKSNKLRAGITFIRPHARKYGLLIIVIGFGVAYLGIQIGDAMYQSNPEPLTPGNKIEAIKTDQQRKSLTLLQQKVEPKTYLVTKVIDGDTFEAQINGKTERIRMLSVDSPEISDQIGKKASAYTQELIEGKRVRLEADKEDRDKYGRLLRYVYIDRKSVQEQLLANGLARVYISQPNTKYLALYQKVQSSAKMKKLGIWAISNEVQANKSVTVRPKPALTENQNRHQKRYKTQPNRNQHPSQIQNLSLSQSLYIIKIALRQKKQVLLQFIEGRLDIAQRLIEIKME